MHIYFRGDELQKLRLFSGLVLFAFAGTHFLNHALGLVSLEVMHQAQDWRTTVTRSLPGSLILLVALISHAGLALYKTAMRHTWRMPPWELAQIASGLAIPFLLLPHIVNTRVAHLVFGVEDSYLYELKRLWPASAWTQSALLLLVWVHGAIGLHHWLRLGETYRRFRPLLALVAVALPVAALAGFAVAGERTAEIMSDADAFAALKARSHWPDDAAGASLERLRLAARIGFAGIVLAVLLAPAWRRWRSDAAPAKVRITYRGGPAVTVEPGQTLLEASRAAGILHASVCGGRARCSTCRVRIEKGLKGLPPPEGAEAVTLAAIGAPPDVRLACQVRPTADLAVALISAPRTPGPAQIAFDEVREAVAAHARARAAGRLVEKAATEPAVLAAWLEGHLGEGRPRLAPASVASGSLRGGRVDHVGDDTVGVAVYAAGDESFSVFLMPARASLPEMVRATHHGYRVIAWADEGGRFLAVAPSGLAGLDDLAAPALAPALAPENVAAVMPETGASGDAR